MLNNKTIAIIGAMDCEIELIKNFLSNAQEIHDKSFTIFLGEINDNKIILAKSGVGKVAAACCTQYIIDKFSPDLIINTGVAGGISPDLKIGDVVIANSFIQHDFDVTALGYARGYICNGVKSDEPTIFYADENLVEILKQASGKILADDNIHIGRIVTGDNFIADIQKKKELRELFNATASEMEGGAIAHTSTLNNIPFVAIRAISDLADGTKIENYPEFEQKTAQISASIIKNLLYPKQSY